MGKIIFIGMWSLSKTKVLSSSGPACLPDVLLEGPGDPEPLEKTGFPLFLLGGSAGADARMTNFIGIAVFGQALCP